MKIAEELMQPRYEVVADYPGNDSYSVGSVIENIGPNYAAMLEDYPHLFRKFEWWDKRDDNEMPQYVKHPKFGVKKVAAKEYDFRTWHVDDEIEHRFAKTGWGEPATEQEYLNYQNK
jgi:hypothetical protein